MSQLQDELYAFFETLRTERDELRVRVSLAGKEVRREWEGMEKQWEHLRGKLEVIGREAGDAARDVGSALRLVGDELRKGYERIRALV